MANKTLAASKMTLQSDLQKAFYDAYMSQCSAGGDQVGGFVKKQFEDSGKKFADELSKQMAEAIYKFAKEIRIDITLSGTVISPSGPCTGAIPAESIVVT